MSTVSSTATLSSGSYVITSTSDLEKLSTMTNNGLIGANTYFCLGNDIDLSSYSNWTPIGSNTTNPFVATFDGNGYEIKNLKINSSTAINQGLFGVVGKSDASVSAVIKNLGVTNVSITASTTVGGTVASLQAGSIIQNCYMSGTINADRYAGGLIGISKGIPIIDKSIIPKSYPKMFIMLNSLYSHIFNFSTFHQKLLPILHARHY